MWGYTRTTTDGYTEYVFFSNSDRTQAEKSFRFKSLFTNNNTTSYTNNDTYKIHLTL